MSFTIDLDLDPIIVEAVKEIGKSDTLNNNIFEVLIYYIKIRFQKLSEKNLKIKQKYIEDQVKNKKNLINNINLESIPLTSKQEKGIIEKKKLLDAYNTLRLFKLGKLTEIDLERHEKEFLAPKEKIKEVKTIPSVKPRPQRNKPPIIKLKNIENNSEIKEQKKTPSLEVKESVELTTENLLNILSNEWQSLKHLIFKMRIRIMMEARFLQNKLKELERKNLIEIQVDMGKKYWRLKQ